MTQLEENNMQGRCLFWATDVETHCDEPEAVIAMVKH